MKGAPFFKAMVAGEVQDGERAVLILDRARQHDLTLLGDQCTAVLVPGNCTHVFQPADQHSVSVAEQGSVSSCIFYLSRVTEIVTKSFGVTSHYPAKSKSKKERR